MINKKSNSYELIKSNTAKLAIIQKVTGISPNNLINIFLRTHQDSDLEMKSRTYGGYREEYWNFEGVSKSAYKYFKKSSRQYLEKARGTSSYEVMLDHIRDCYLTCDYFGMDYEELELTYRSQELILKTFVRDAFIAIHPITPDMSAQERAVRNQKLGKISVNHWIGDIVNYAYYEQAPDFMMKNVKTAINRVEFYVLNLLHEKDLDHDLEKLASNLRLQEKMIPKEAKIKQKVNKI